MQFIKNKKRIIVISSVFLLILLLSCGAFVSFSLKDNVEENNNDDQEVKVNIKDSIILEYGANIPDIEDFFDGTDLKDGKVEIYFNGDMYSSDVLTEFGKYDVKIVVGDNVYESEIVVTDKEAPVLELKEVSIKENEIYDVNSFVVKCEDNAKVDCILNFGKEEMSSYVKAGIYDIEVVARDESGNESKMQTRLTISEGITSNSEANKGSNNSDNSINTNTNSENVNSNGSNTNNDNQNKGESGSSSNSSVSNSLTSDFKGEAINQKNVEATNINQILTETNKYRAEVGLSALILDDNLTIAANLRAIEMAKNNEFSHTRPDGTPFYSVLVDFSIRYMTAGENIAYGQQNGLMAANSWRNSPGHYANITNENFGKIGIGVYKYNGKYYYVQLFTN